MGDDCLLYTLFSYVPRLGLFFVAKREWKVSTFIGVLEQTGEQFELPDTPHISPDGRYIAAISASEVSWKVNGIDVWSVAGGKPKLEFTYRVPDDRYALYKFLGWRGNDEVKLTAEVIDTPGQEAQTRSGVVRRAKQGWRLNLDR
jgi:hypothetical protein